MNFLIYGINGTFRGFALAEIGLRTANGCQQAAADRSGSSFLRITAPTKGRGARIALMLPPPSRFSVVPRRLREEKAEVHRLQSRIRAAKQLKKRSSKMHDSLLPQE